MKYIVTDFNTYSELNEALLPSEYRAYYKYWNEVNAGEVHKNLFTNKGRIYISYNKSIKDEIIAYLNTIGYKEVYFESGYVIDKYSRKMKIGKVLQKHGNSDLLLKYQKENKRDRVYDTSDLIVCISRNAYDIAGCSTGRDWSSCVSIYGGHKKTLYADIKEGTMIAYLIHKDDLNIEKPITRISIRPYEKDDGTRIYIPETKMYGEQNWDFREVVYQWSKDWQNLESGSMDGEYYLVGGLYDDGLSTIIIEDGEVDAITKKIISGSEIYDDDIALELVVDFYKESGYFESSDESFYEELIDDIVDKYIISSDMFKYGVINKRSHGIVELDDYVNLTAYTYSEPGKQKLTYNNSSCEFSMYIDIVEFYNDKVNQNELYKYIKSSYGDYGEFKFNFIYTKQISIHLDIIKNIIGGMFINNIGFDYDGLLTGMNLELYKKIMSGGSNLNQTELFMHESIDDDEIQNKLNKCIPYDNVDCKGYFKKYVDVEFTKGGSDELKNIILDIFSNDFDIIYNKSNDVIRGSYDIDNFYEYQDDEIDRYIENGDIKVDCNGYRIIYLDEYQ